MVIPSPLRPYVIEHFGEPAPNQVVEVENFIMLLYGYFSLNLMVLELFRNSDDANHIIAHRALRAWFVELRKRVSTNHTITLLDLAMVLHDTRPNFTRTGADTLKRYTGLSIEQFLLSVARLTPPP